MAPQEKKWTDAAERDLCVSIIYSHQSRYDWSRVTTIMEGLGYTFTKDAMTQHLSKSILRAFKDRCSDEVIAAAEATPPASATKPKATPRKGTASTPRKRTKNGVKGPAGDNNNNDDEVDDEMALDATPTKKLKKEDKVKKEEKEKVKKEEAPATPTAAADQSAASDGEEKARGSDAESSA
ncbi:hypothetical protein V8C44DRAFT_362914 [Trichoderma aethiopicum]